MKNLPLYVSIYSFLLLMGGGIGYLMSGSVMSLAMSLVFSIALFACAKDTSTLRGKIGVLLVLVLTLFFGYRFAKTGQWPGLVFGLLSLGVLSLQLLSMRLSTQFHK